jgi:hypothetical protein
MQLKTKNTEALSESQLTSGNLCSKIHSTLKKPNLAFESNLQQSSFLCNYKQCCRTLQGDALLVLLGRQKDREIKKPQNVKVGVALRGLVVVAAWRCTAFLLLRLANI